MSSENDKRDEDLKKVPFETALDQAGFGMYSYLLTAFTGLSIISMACITYGSTIIAPTSACELNTTAAQQGFIVSGPILGMILGAVLWGHLADTRGRRKMMLISFASSAVVNAVASLSVHWVMLMVLQFIASILAVGQYSIGMSLLSECVPLAKRNLVVLIVASIFMLSQGVMSVLAIPIIPLNFSYYISFLDIYWNSWRTVLLVYSLPCVICFIWLYFLKESPKFVYSKGNVEESLDILKAIHRINKPKGGELQVQGLLEEKSEDSGVPKEGLAMLFKAPLLKYVIIMSLLTILLKASAFMVWLPTILNQFVQILRSGEGTDLTICEIILQDEIEADNNLPPCALDVTSLLLVFAVGGVQSIFNICVSLVVNQLGRRNMVIGIAGICGLSGILVNLVPNAIGSALLFLIFLLAMVNMGLYTAISVALFPTRLKALALGLTMTSGRITLVAMVQVLNYLLETNCELGFYLFASFVVSSAVIASFLPDDRRLKKPIDPLEPRPEIMGKDQDFISTEKGQMEAQRL